MPRGMLNLFIIGFVSGFLLFGCNQVDKVSTEADALFSLEGLNQAKKITLTLKEIQGLEPDSDTVNKEITYDPKEDDLSDLNTSSVLANATGLLAYIRTDGLDRWDIWTNNQETDTRLKIYQGTTEIQSVGVSADGQVLVASILNPATSSFDIFKFSLVAGGFSPEAGGIEQLSADSSDEINVSITSDGSRIAWQGMYNEKATPFICTYIGASCFTSVLANKFSQREPSLSANGNYLALVQEVDNGLDRVRIFDFTNNLYTNVMSDILPLSFPSLSNDGQWVMYKQDSRKRNNRQRILLKNVATSEVTVERSVFDPLSLEHPFLTADGKYMVYGTENSLGRIVPFSRELETNLQALPQSGDFSYKGMVWQQAVSKPAGGSLDESFGEKGMVTTDFSGSRDFARSMAIDSNQDYIVVGTALMNKNYDFALARYKPDGSLDLNFGENGKVTTDFASNWDWAYAAVIDSKDRIIMGGSSTAVSSTGSSLSQHIALVRYRYDGSLDPSFGIGGKAMPFASGYQDFVNSIVIDKNHKIVIAGHIIDNNKSYSNFLVARLNSDGTLDSSFGENGKVSTDINGLTDIAKSVFLDEAGNIIVVGSSFSKLGREDIAIVKYNADGSLDQSFGISGKISTDFNGQREYINTATIDKKGRIIVAGSLYTGKENLFLVLRYNPDGSLDQSFARGGVSITNLPGTSEGATGVLVDANSRIIATGYASQGGNGGDNFALIRYLENGILDSSFGENGKVTTDFTLPNQYKSDDSSFASRIDVDGGIVVVGMSSVQGTQDDDFALARYHP